jgi:phosphatidylinositol dimannoside acyltransferase
VSLLTPVRDRASDLTYATGWSAVKRLPEPAARTLFDAAGDLAHRLDGKGVGQLRRNLAHVVPGASDHELEELTRAAMRSYLRYWRESFRLPTWSAAEVERRMVVHDRDLLDAAIDEGQGVVVVAGHLGNWDHVAAWAAGQGIAVTSVAERLRPERLFERFVAYRESLGMEILPLTGDRDLTTDLLRHLREGRVLALLADRDLAHSAVDVTLLGRPARMPGGPAALAKRAGAVLLPMSSWYDETHTHLRLHPRLQATPGLRFRDAVTELTQLFADVLGQAITAHPTDWHMLQRVWLDDDEGGAR